MIITICGSMKFMNQMLSTKQQLENQNHQVFLPTWENLHLLQTSPGALLAKKREYILYHFDQIKKSEAILVLNYSKNGIKNYIGGNSLIEIAIAFEHQKRIYILNSLPDESDLSYVLEIKAMKPIILNGNLSKLK